MSTRLTRALGRAPTHVEYAWRNIRLAPRNWAQILRFRRLRKRFQSQYALFDRADLKRFTVPHWDEFNKQFAAFLLPRPTLHFLKNAQLRSQMFVDERYLDHELPFLDSFFEPSTKERLLVEDSVGFPYLLTLPSLPVTSANRLHTLYHLARLIEATSLDLEADVRTVVEWGGGYGSMARVATRMLGQGATYVLIDTPLLSCLQWLYLTSVLGEERVTLISDVEISLRSGAINVVPVHLVESLDVRCDLFISTWALDESSLASQRLVASNKWFGATNLLLATARTPPSKGSDHSGRNDQYLIEQAEAIGGNEHEISFMPWSRYTFC